MDRTTTLDYAPAEQGRRGRGLLGPYGRRPMPRAPALLGALGPGIIWLALAQGSGELIWWPYIVAKYGLGFLCLLIPACLLQYPLNYQIGQYTLLTGETVWQGLIRLNRWFALALWGLMTVSFLWLGAFVTAGALAMGALTDFPSGWSASAQMYFWAHVFITVSLLALLLSPVMYRLIEIVMLVVTVVTVVGLVAACSDQAVRQKIPEFLGGLVGLGKLTRPFDAAADTKRLLTAITFAGLGGFWTLFYSYWLRDKNSAMAGHIGRITSPITGKPEAIPEVGFVPTDTPEDRTFWRRWRRIFLIDNGVGIAGNIFTTLMTCLLAFAILHPKGLLPKGDELTTVQAAFFEQTFGPVGRSVFLIIAVAFLSDTWLTTVDALGRVHTDVLRSYLPPVRQLSHRTCYVLVVLVLTVVCSVTMYFARPGPLILITGVIGFAGTVTYSIALLILNHFVLPRHLPRFARPGKVSLIGISISCTAYLVLMGWYLWAEFGH